MNFGQSFRLALKSLTTSKMRSLLTMLGIHGFHASFFFRKGLRLCRVVRVHHVTIPKLIQSDFTFYTIDLNLVFLRFGRKLFVCWFFFTIFRIFIVEHVGI